MNISSNFPVADEPGYLLELADALENSEETTLGPTDARSAATALRHYAAFLDAHTPFLTSSGSPRSR